MPHWPDFLEKLLLLLCTAGISGLLVPYVLKTIEHQRALRDKKFEADRARQESVIKAQAEFLDRLTEKLWAWRYLTIRVTYYGGEDDVTRYQTAKSVYAEQFWPVLNGIRTEISRSCRLLSPSLVERIRLLYAQIIQIDQELLRTAKEADQSLRRILYMDMNNRIFGSTSEEIDGLLQAIAVDLHLSDSRVLISGE